MKQMGDAQFQRAFYEHVPHLPPKDWPYRTTASTVRRGDIAPRARQPDDCPTCEGSGWASDGKGRTTGTRKYVQCRDCRGKGKAAP